MTRYVVAGLIVLGLAIGVWLLLPRGNTTPSTTVVASGTSTTTAPPVTTAPPTTTTSPPEGHVVTTVEQAEEILRDLWFGWFEGIYNQDEARIREVVATEDLIASAVEQFGVMHFEQRPLPDGLNLAQLEILHSDGECLAIWGELTTEFREGYIASVHLLRFRAGLGWAFVSFWSNRADQWSEDCDAVLS